MTSHSNLRFVTLRCAIETWNEPTTRTLFSEIVQLKLNGYRSEYPAGILPIDGADFVADQLLICETTAKGLIPIAGYKSITLARCNYHSIKFPLLSLTLKHSRHQSFVQETLTSHRTSPSSVAYNGSWTIAPQKRHDRDLVSNLKEMMIGLGVSYCREAGISRLLGVGVLKNKADKYFREWGFEFPCDPSNRILEPFEIEPFFNTVSRIVYLENFSDFAIRCAAKYREMWTTRIDYSAESAVSKAA